MKPGKPQGNRSKRPSADARRERAAQLVATGTPTHKAAKAAGTDKDAFAEWLRTDCGTAALARYNAQHAKAMASTITEGRELLKAGALASIMALLDTVRSARGLARIKAAEAILDRVGLPRVQKVEGTVSAKHDLSGLSDDELEQLAELTAKIGGAA